MLYRGTSGEAWDRFIPISAALDRQIMTALWRAEPRGLICQEIEQTIGRNHQAVSGNLRHLVERGFVMPTDICGVTSSNRRAIKWRIAPSSLWGQDQRRWLDRREAANALTALVAECRDVRKAMQASTGASPVTMANLARWVGHLADRIETVADGLTGEE